MKRKYVYALAGLMCLGFASCGTSHKATTADLAGEWDIVAINGEKVNLTEGAEQPYLGFDTADGSVFGLAGCNRVLGSFDVKATEEGKLSLAQMGATRMMCPDMSVEDAVLKACGEVNSFKVTDGGLELCDASGKPVLTLSPRQAVAEEQDYTTIEE